MRTTCRCLLTVGRVIIWIAVLCGGSVWPQGFPAGATNPGSSAAPPASPNAEAARPEPPRYAQVSDASPAPSQGQIWREYDLRPYLNRVRGMEEPERSVMEWILRETGSDRWFGNTPGMISFEADKLRVYHLPEVQAVVAQIVDRFVNPELAKSAVSVRLVTVENPAWRSIAMPLMEPIRVETPGLQAWTLTRENAAHVGAQLRSHVEYRIHNSTNVLIGHGQTHKIERWQPRTYPEQISRTSVQYAGQQVVMGEIQEGFTLQLSPLATADGTSMEAVIRCHADQVERMTPVTLSPATGSSLSGGLQIQVPQISSWRLYERFRWRTDHVLLISRGMVAMPGIRGAAVNPLSSMVASPPARADVLLILDCRSSTSGMVEASADGTRVGRVNYHGRY